jgi:L,D-transpeptidase YbiS
MTEPGPETHLIVDLSSQRLRVLAGSGALREYSVSTATRGAGEMTGSRQTPRGQHVIRAKIGAGAPPGAVFVGRRPTGEIWSPELAARFPARDWILSRILWLSGTEVGRNRLGNVDTMRRYIYIHGTPALEPMGVAASHGCIRMRNSDVIQLFDLVHVGTRILIQEDA